MSRLNEQLAWLFARQRFGVKPGLERVRALLESLGDPQRHFKTVLVGGTNGKGSTASSLAAVVKAGGTKVGLFTSPHLSHVSERFLVDGQAVSEQRLDEAFLTVRPGAESLEATFFEIVTAMACQLFAASGVDLAVMEVGLGGRFDATNVLDPVLSIITNVDLDHTTILGDSPASIAAEKAGIVRPAMLMLTGAEGEALSVLEAVAAELESPLWRLGREIVLELESSGWEGSAFRLTDPSGDTALSLKTPLLGEHQARNAALAASAARALQIEEVDIRDGLLETRWPGRLEALNYRGRRFVLDGAHNPSAAEALGSALRQLGSDPAVFVLGLSEDKDARAVLQALEPLASRVILTRAALSPRAASPERLERALSGGAYLTETPEAAVELALDLTGPGELVVVAGSLYLIGEIRPLLLGRRGERFERRQ